MNSIIDQHRDNEYFDMDPNKILSGARLLEMLKIHVSFLKKEVEEVEEEFKWETLTPRKVEPCRCIACCPENPDLSNYARIYNLSVGHLSKDDLLLIWNSVGNAIQPTRFHRLSSCKPGLRFLIYREGNRNSVEISYTGIFYGKGDKILASNFEDIFNKP